MSGVRGRGPGDDAGGAGSGAVTVRGGAGGTKACLTALITGALRAERAAEHLDEAVRLAAGARRTMALTSAAAPTSGARAAATLHEITDRSTGLPRCADGLHHLAAALRGTAEAYARADHASAVRLQIPAVLGWTIGELVPGTVLGLGVLGLSAFALGSPATMAARLLRDTPTTLGLALSWLGSDDRRGEGGLAGAVAWLLGGPGVLPALVIPSPREVEALLPGVAALLLGLAPGPSPEGGRPVAAAAAALALATAASARLQGRSLPGLVVAPLVQAKGGKADPRETQAQSVTDVLRLVDRVYDSTPGAVGVQRIDHADGTRSWVVAIPGTQEGSFGGPVPTDLTSNLELMGGAPDDRTETVIQAMKQAGIRPDEPVVLAGHSQGGMVAVRAAMEVGDRFTIVDVITAGSPVGGMALPEDIPALHIEHEQDYLAAVDGSPNPDEPNRTTVTRDLTVPVGGATPEAPASLADVFVAPHEMSAYIDTAKVVEKQDDRSVTAFLAGLDSVLDDGTGEVSTQVFVGVRVPEDASALVDGVPVGSGVLLGARGAKGKVTSWS